MRPIERQFFEMFPVHTAEYRVLYRLNKVNKYLSPPLFIISTWKHFDFVNTIKSSEWPIMY